jgi:chromosome segregation ATPase
MSKSDPSICNDQAGKSSRAKRTRSTSRRVDAPHSAGYDPPKQPAGENTLATQTSPAEAPASDLLKLQAEQIAAHLRLRQKELDHREAELNSLTARLESDARSARLWLSERETELASRAEEAAELQANLLKQQQAFEQQPRTIESQAQQFEQHWSAGSGDLADREAALRSAIGSLEARKQQLNEAESRIAIAQADIQRIQEELLTERRAFQEEVVAARRQMADERREAMADLERKRQAVQRRSEHVDHCRAALMQVHTELQRAQRETLEVRLATEELWVHLSGAAPPATVTRSLGRIRARLAENYHHANTELTQRKEELESIRAQLTEQHGNVLKQKRHFEEWVACQREEIDQQASRLVARERQLHGEESRLREESHSWRGERLEYQQEIRRLRAELATRDEANMPVPCTL